MKQYKGCYIDNVVFHNEVEVDSFLKEKAVNAFRTAVRMFVRKPSMEASIYADEKAEYLHTQFGIDWSEIEAIENETMMG